MLFKRHYPALDLLRALAITMVILRHFGDRAVSLPQDSYISTMILWGANGVALFFALSGFLIGGQIIEEVMHGGFSFRRFYFKRFWRIFPPYYCSLLVVSLLFFSGLADYNVVNSGTSTVDFLKDLIRHVFYLQNYTPSRIQGSLYWTLAVEEQFYLLVPLLLYLFLRFAGSYLSSGLTLLVLSAIGLRFILFSTLDGGPYDFSALFEHPFHMRFDSLLLGVLAAYLFIVYNDRLRAGRGLWLFAVALLPLLVSFLNTGTEKGYFAACWDITLTGIGFSALTLWSAYGTPVIFKPLKPLFSYIARISYTMYLYHLILLYPTALILRRFLNVDSFAKFFLAFFIYYLVVVLFSDIIYRIVDRPCMNYRKMRLEMMNSTNRASLKPLTDSTPIV